VILISRLSEVRDFFDENISSIRPSIVEEVNAVFIEKWPMTRVWPITSAVTLVQLKTEYQVVYGSCQSSDVGRYLYVSLLSGTFSGAKCREKFWGLCPHFIRCPSSISLWISGSLDMKNCIELERACVSL